jgi:hypothetical protein
LIRLRGSTTKPADHSFLAKSISHTKTNFEQLLLKKMPKHVSIAFHSLEEVTLDILRDLSELLLLLAQENIFQVSIYDRYGLLEKYFKDVKSYYQELRNEWEKDKWVDLRLVNEHKINDIDNSQQNDLHVQFLSFHQHSKPFLSKLVIETSAQNVPDFSVECLDVKMREKLGGFQDLQLLVLFGVSLNSLSLDGFPVWLLYSTEIM